LGQAWDIAILGQTREEKVAVLGATLLISIALKDKKGTRYNLQWTETLLLAAVKRDRLRWMPLPKSLDF
jgi:hypothetical protein